MEDTGGEVNLLPYSSRFYHFLCGECLNTPKLEFDKQSRLFFVQCCCDKDRKILRDINYLKNNYIYESDEEDVLKCQEHFKDFKEYCQTCMKNYCENCERCNHTLENIDNNNLDDYIENLKKLCFPNNEVEQEMINLNNIRDETKILHYLVSIIINDYLRVKNYHLYICIKNLEKNYKEIIPTSNSGITETEYCINSPQELKSSEQINKVEIYQYCFDLNKLKVNLPNLKEISLKNNNISDVSILINCEFKNLEKLYLDINKIDNTILTYLGKMKFEKLKVFSLKQNYLTDYKIFEEVKVFKSLTKFDISSNRFNNKDYFQNKKIDLNAIEELILSNGVFDEESINNISSLNLINLKKIDLSCNNLSSLGFILRSNWPKLEELNLNENDISDIKELITKFKESIKLKIIIENNLIKNENQINELVNSNENITIKYKLNCIEIENENNINDRDTSTDVNT